MLPRYSCPRDSVIPATEDRARKWRAFWSTKDSVQSPKTVNDNISCIAIKWIPRPSRWQDYDFVRVSHIYHHFITTFAPRIPRKTVPVGRLDEHRLAAIHWPNCHSWIAHNSANDPSHERLRSRHHDIEVYWMDWHVVWERAYGKTCLRRLGLRVRMIYKLAKLLRYANPWRPLILLIKWVEDHVNPMIFDGYQLSGKFCVPAWERWAFAMQQRALRGVLFSSVPTVVDISAPSLWLHRRPRSEATQIRLAVNMPAQGASIPYCKDYWYSSHGTLPLGMRITARRSCSSLLVYWCRLSGQSGLIELRFPSIPYL